MLLITSGNASVTMLVVVTVGGPHLHHASGEVMNDAAKVAAHVYIACYVQNLLWAFLAFH